MDLFRPSIEVESNSGTREISLDTRHLMNRRLFINGEIDSDMDQASVMRIAGHASPQTMRHYVRTARIQKDIGEKFDSVFN